MENKELRGAALPTAEETQERVILVGITGGNEQDAMESLDELEELARTAGAVTVGRVLQGRNRPDPAAYIGSGKIEELRMQIAAMEADGIICDDELSPAQMRNLAKELDCKVVDRTLLILDIFAARAGTSEGKIQVELAQLSYRLTMLSGLGTSLSRLGGGIGTRGPGEKKLEVDRRRIRSRISRLKAELAEVTAHRELLHENREKRHLPSAALVGYTNAGKSSLLNTLTGAGVLQENKLFATLDPTTRVLPLPDGQEVLLTDTVGFIRKLPHQLVSAFRSTLEEARYADILIHVVDTSNPQMDKQMHVVYDTLHELGIEDKPVITLFNKMDLAEETDGAEPFVDRRADHTIRCSARTGLGLEQLRQTIGDMLTADQILIERVLGYGEAGKLQLIRKYGRLLEEEYTGEGIRIKAYVPREVYGRI